MVGGILTDCAMTFIVKQDKFNLEHFWAKLMIYNTISNTWKNHLYEDDENIGLLKELSKRIRMLKKLRKSLPTAKFKMIYSGLFTSILIYGITACGSVWG